MVAKSKNSGRWKAPAHVAWRKVGGEAVLLDLNTSEYFSLNEVGALVWERVCAGDSLPAIQARVCREYSVKPTQADGDVRALIQSLVKKKLLAAA